VLIELANHNEDIRRLLDKGYALRVDGTYLVVRDIPYLDDKRSRQIGAIVTKLEFVDKVRVRQDDHQIYFAGSAPHEVNGAPIPNLGGGPISIPLGKTDLVVERSFSNKPKDQAGNRVGFANFFDKIEHYVNVLSGPAIALHGGTPLTFRADEDVLNGSVFKLHDTLTSRAEIGDLIPVFREEVIAIIGLGGTGSYVLDFLVKTLVREIRAFDGDTYYVHNAFRSPGRLEELELGKLKADIYSSRYGNFRHGVHFYPKYVDHSSRGDLEGVTFAFVCVDKGAARAEIFDLLIEMRIPFIDVGMGLNRKQGPIGGTLRATYYSVENAAAMRELRLAEMADHPDDVYRASVQIAELNALNACMAVIRYKQLRGFYVHDNAPYHLLFGIESLHTFGMTAP
jgi:hypothetical protein